MHVVDGLLYLKFVFLRITGGIHAHSRRARPPPTAVGGGRSAAAVGDPPIADPRTKPAPRSCRGPRQGCPMLLLHGAVAERRGKGERRRHPRGRSSSCGSTCTVRPLPHQPTTAAASGLRPWSSCDGNTVSCVHFFDGGSAVAVPHRNQAGGATRGALGNVIV